ncbi:MAG: hypothetical protein GWP06_02205 [Actinobacteria bacterium]|nr:hypothetical protein [Actinomycetota bacterium]
MKLADLYVKLGIKKEGFDKGIDQAKKKTNSFGSSMKKLGGIIAGAFAVGAIIRFSKIALEKYNIQAQAETQLLVALKGRKAAQQDLIHQAQQLQKITLFGDEDTIRAQALIAAFVREKDQIKEVIPLVQDFASAKMMPLAAAADLVSKTLGSSTNALTRYGIQVKGAVGSQERLTSVVNGLSKAFAGQSVAAAKAGTGGITQLKNAWGDLEEAFGKRLVSPVNLALIRLLTKFLGGVENKIKKIKKFTDEGIFTKDWLKNANLKDLQTELDITQKQFKIFLDSYKKAKAEGNKDKEGFFAGVTDVARENIEKLNAAIKKIKLSNPDTKPIVKAVTLLKAAKIAAQDAHKALNDFMAKGGKFHGEKSAQDFLDKFNKLQKAIETADAAYQKMKGHGTETPVGTLKPKGINGNIADGLNPNADIVVKPPDFSSFNKVLAKQLQITAQFNDNLTNLIAQGLASAISTMAEGLGELAASEITGKEFGAQILQTVGRFLEQMGSLLITYAVNMALVAMNIGDPAAWPVVLAAGIAMVAAGAAISSLGKKGLSGGGGAGGYIPASGYSPHSSQAATILQGKVVFELDGTVLKGALINTDRMNKLIG